MFRFLLFLLRILFVALRGEAAMCHSIAFECFKISAFMLHWWLEASFVYPFSHQNIQPPSHADIQPSIAQTREVVLSPAHLLFL